MSDRPGTPLESAVWDSGYRKGFVAEQLGVAPYTVSRWLAGTLMPSQENRQRLADLLGREESSIWPERVEASTHTREPA
jgi:transcriptional regulator with XRE-family HTH domain